VASSAWKGTTAKNVAFFISCSVVLFLLHLKRHEPGVPFKQVTVTMGSGEVMQVMPFSRHLIVLLSGHLTLPVSSSPTTPLNDKSKLFNFMQCPYSCIFLNGPMGYLNIINFFTHGIPANLFPTALGMIGPRKQDSIAEFWLHNLVRVAPGREMLFTLITSMTHRSILAQKNVEALFCPSFCQFLAKFND
jgi:hypothetical protein